jgi:hypothetical protein
MEPKLSRMAAPPAAKGKFSRFECCLIRCRLFDFGQSLFSASAQPGYRSHGWTSKTDALTH